MAGRWFYSTLLLMAMTSCTTVRQGDLLFHVAPQHNAITSVTPGMIDHVAIAVSKDSVIEAVKEGVKLTAINELWQQEGYYIISKVREADCKQSVKNARSYLGRSYDHVFLADNEDIYCSELVQLSFVDKQGKRLFETIPMSFHDETGQVTEYWQRFYAERGMQVPEGEPGSNPGELSQRSCIIIKGKRNDTTKVVDTELQEHR